MKIYSWASHAAGPEISRRCGTSIVVLHSAFNLYCERNIGVRDMSAGFLHVILDFIVGGYKSISDARYGLCQESIANIYIHNKK